MSKQENKIIVSQNNNKKKKNASSQKHERKRSKSFSLKNQNINNVIMNDKNKIINAKIIDEESISLEELQPKIENFVEECQKVFEENEENKLKIDVLINQKAKLFDEYMSEIEHAHAYEKILYAKYIETEVSLISAQQLNCQYRKQKDAIEMEYKQEIDESQIKLEQISNDLQHAFDEVAILKESLEFQKDENFKLNKQIYENNKKIEKYKILINNFKGIEMENEKLKDENEKLIDNNEKLQIKIDELMRNQTLSNEKHANLNTLSPNQKKRPMSAKSGDTIYICDIAPFINQSKTDEIDASSNAIDDDNYSVQSNYDSNEIDMDEKIDDMNKDIQQLKKIISNMESNNFLIPQLINSVDPIARLTKQIHILLSQNPNMKFNNQLNKNIFQDWAPSVFFSSIVLIVSFFLIKYQNSDTTLGKLKGTQNMKRKPF